MLLEFDKTYFIIFSLIAFISTLLIAKYSNSFFLGSLLDKDFLKPQAFHKKPIARIGGFAILLLFGGKKIPELMKGLGKGISEFKKAKQDISEETEDKDEK